jgi:endonuclease G, mitochondrial
MKVRFRMSAPQNKYAFDLDVAIAAANRWDKRNDQHEKFKTAAQTKQYTSLDTPERRAARANRLLRKLREAAPREAELISLRIDSAEVTPETASDALLERVIGKTRDFLFVEFLEKGMFASRSIGRVVTTLGGGRMAYGTGFMVSPHLLMTNHHVLQSADIAARSTIEFDYQRHRLGHDLTVQTFTLAPAVFFLSDKALDFALVAVSPNGGERPLATYLWCPLRPDAGKIVAGEPINIIQHPKGDRKQVIVRENRLIDSLEDRDNFYHYEADTEPGSSGSPVFNDQWEVIALHHSGVPRRNLNGQLLDVGGHVWREGDDPSRLDWVANEGVRISKLVQHIAAAKVDGEDRKQLVQELLDAKAPEEQLESLSDSAKSKIEPPSHTVSMIVPIRLTMSVGEGLAATGTIALTIGDGTHPRDEALFEKVEIDPDYSTRQGFDPKFLSFDVPFPRLTSATRPQAYALLGQSGDARFELKYHHYSVLLNKERRLAFVAGVNFDPTAKFQHIREKDQWFYDPRVKPENLQAGEALYTDNPLDRGHLVRRADAAWGNTKAEAKLANDDTFHFTNCAPQHAITNQGKQRIKDGRRVIKAPPGLKLWGKLEEHIAAQGKAARRKLSVFNGPVFRSSDEEYRGVQIPEEYWKVVVFAEDSGDPSAVGFVLTQAELIQDLKEEFEVGEYKAVQVRLQDLESRTKLDFGPIASWDVLEREGAEENFTGDISAVVLNSVNDMIL